MYVFNKCSPTYMFSSSPVNMISLVTLDWVLNLLKHTDPSIFLWLLVCTLSPFLESYILLSRLSVTNRLIGYYFFFSMKNEKMTSMLKIWISFYSAYE